MNRAPHRLGLGCIAVAFLLLVAAAPSEATAARGPMKLSAAASRLLAVNTVSGAAPPPPDSSANYVTDDSNSNSSGSNTTSSMPSSDDASSSSSSSSLADPAPSASANYMLHVAAGVIFVLCIFSAVAGLCVSGGVNGCCCCLSFCRHFLSAGEGGGDDNDDTASRGSRIDIVVVPATDDGGDERPEADGDDDSRHGGGGCEGEDESAPLLSHSRRCGGTASSHANSPTTTRTWTTTTPSPEGSSRQLGRWPSISQRWREALLGKRQSQRSLDAFDEAEEGAEGAEQRQDEDSEDRRGRAAQEHLFTTTATATVAAPPSSSAAVVDLCAAAAEESFAPRQESASAFARPPLHDGPVARHGSSSSSSISRMAAAAFAHQHLYSNTTNSNGNSHHGHHHHLRANSYGEGTAGSTTGESQDPFPSSTRSASSSTATTRSRRHRRSEGYDYYEPCQPVRSNAPSSNVTPTVAALRGDASSSCTGGGGSAEVEDDAEDDSTNTLNHSNNTDTDSERGRVSAGPHGRQSSRYSHSSFEESTSASVQQQQQQQSQRYHHHHLHRRGFSSGDERNCNNSGGSGGKSHDADASRQEYTCTGSSAMFPSSNTGGLTRDDGDSSRSNHTSNSRAGSRDSVNSAGSVPRSNAPDEYGLGAALDDDIAFLEGGQGNVSLGMHHPQKQQQAEDEDSAVEQSYGEYSCLDCGLGASGNTGNRMGGGGGGGDTSSDNITITITITDNNYCFDALDDDLCLYMADDPSSVVGPNGVTHRRTGHTPVIVFSGSSGSSTPLLSESGTHSTAVTPTYLLATRSGTPRSARSAFLAPPPSHTNHSGGSASTSTRRPSRTPNPPQQPQVYVSSEIQQEQPQQEEEEQQQPAYHPHKYQHQSSYGTGIPLYPEFQNQCYYIYGDQVVLPPLACTYNGGKGTLVGAAASTATTTTTTTLTPTSAIDDDDGLTPSSTVAVPLPNAGGHRRGGGGGGGSSSSNHDGGDSDSDAPALSVSVGGQPMLVSHNEHSSLVRNKTWLSLLVDGLEETVVPVVTAAGKKAALFPVRRIYCVGQNYESHAREMGGHSSKHSPFFFCKPTDSLVTSRHTHQPLASADCDDLSIRYPTVTESYHHEVELVIALGPRRSLQATESPADGSVEYADAELSYANIPMEEVDDIIYAYGVGLDMTRRDLQAQAKEHGKPWDLAKGPDDGAVLSPLVLASDLKASHPALFTSAGAPVCGSSGSVEETAAVGAGAVAVTAGAGAPPASRSLDIRSGEIHLSVNGNERQKGNLDCMINTPAEIVSILSKLVTLHAGDLIYTGTPAGVAPVRRGDKITAGIAGIAEITVSVV